MMYGCVEGRRWRCRLQALKLVVFATSLIWYILIPFMNHHAIIGGESGCLAYLTVAVFEKGIRIDWAVGIWLCQTLEIDAKTVDCRGGPFTTQGKQISHFYKIVIPTCLPCVQVDGLYRLMNGDHTGPINIGNPGAFLIFACLTHTYASMKSDQGAIAPVTALSVVARWWTMFFSLVVTSNKTGEFTMLELAGLVKEVTFKT